MYARYSPSRFPPLASSKSVASELLEAFRAGEGVDLVRESVGLVMQELIETEATEHIGARRMKPGVTGDGPERVPAQAGSADR